VATSLLIRQYVSKGFAYIAIIVIITAASFIIILDILKYGFGIDLAQKERDRIRHKRASHNKNNRKTRMPQKAIRLRRMNKIVYLP
jgi:choline-glycine betaine transporter